MYSYQVPGILQSLQDKAALPWDATGLDTLEDLAMEHTTRKLHKWH